MLFYEVDSGVAVQYLALEDPELRRTPKAWHCLCRRTSNEALIEFVEIDEERRSYFLQLFRPSEVARMRDLIFI